MLLNVKGKNAMLRNIFPLQEWTDVNLDKKSPTSNTDDIEKHVANEVLKEEGEVVIPDGIFLTYKKHASMFTPKILKFICRLNRTVCTPLKKNVVVLGTCFQWHPLSFY